MEHLGISWPLALAQITTLALIVSWLIVTYLALRRLYAYRFAPFTVMLWALLSIFVPYVVALAFLRAYPPQNKPLASDRPR